MNMQVDLVGDPAVAKWIKLCDETKEDLTGLVITDENAKPATDSLHDLKVHVKGIKERRVAITKPMDEAKKEAIRQERIVVAPIQELIEWLGGSLLEYQVEKQRREEEYQRLLIEQEKVRLEAEMKLLEEQAELNQSNYALGEAMEVEEQIEAVTNMVPKSTGKIRGMGSTSSVSYKYGFNVVDFDLVPDEYKMLNEVKIRGAIRGAKGTHTIPGLKITKQPVLTTRGR